MTHLRSAFPRVAAALLFASQAGTALAAGLTPDEQALVAGLDRAFRPGMLDTSNKQKRADGSYVRSVSTGDAIISSTIGAPLAVLRKACSASNASLELRLSAGRNPREESGVLNLAGTRLEVDRRMLWSTFTITDHYSFPTLLHGFRPLFSTSPFADRAAREADRDPPFGLFACKAADGTDSWAAAIMPLGGPDSIYLTVQLTPITSRWVHDYLAEKEADRVSAERSVREEQERQARAVANAQAEETRLRPFQASLRIGSRTNCGIVIAVRNPLVQVQLPPNVLGPGGAREFWVPRDELTDAIPPTGCRFGG